MVCIGLMIINGLKMSQGERLWRCRQSLRAPLIVVFFRLNYWWMPCMMVSQRCRRVRCNPISIGLQLQVICPTWLCLATRVLHGHNSSQWRLNNTIAMACCCCRTCSRWMLVLWNYLLTMNMYSPSSQNHRTGIWRNIVEHDITWPQLPCLCKENGLLDIHVPLPWLWERRGLLSWIVLVWPILATGLWEVSPCLRNNLLTNGLLNYTSMSYVLYTIDIIADGLKSSSWQESSLDDKLPELVALHGNKTGVPLNFLHVVLGRDAFPSVTDRSLFYNTDAELKKAMKQSQDFLGLNFDPNADHWASWTSKLKSNAYSQKFPNHLLLLSSTFWNSNSS